MLFVWLILAILMVLLVAAAPRWHYSRSWGYFPLLIVAITLVLLVGLLLLGWLPFWSDHGWWHHDDMWDHHMRWWRNR